MTQGSELLLLLTVATVEEAAPRARSARMANVVPRRIPVISNIDVSLSTSVSTFLAPAPKAMRAAISRRRWAVE